MPEKLRADDFRFIFMCLIAAGMALIFSIKYFHAAFPEASLNIDVRREESRPIAEQFLSARGYTVNGYRHSAVFDYDEQAKVFLEKEMGLERAQRVLGSTIKLWRWSHRWFRPLQKEEFRVDVTPQGEIVGFQHLVREEAPGASLTARAAQDVAETFLVEVMHKDLTTLEFIQAHTQQRPHRTDHIFTWRERSFDVRGASYRFEVTVQGDEIGGYREYLKVPEQWTRRYRKLRSLNQTTGMVDTMVMLALFVGLLVILVQRIRREDIRWKVAFTFGVLTTGLNFLASLNELPIREFYYPTTESYPGFLIGIVLDSLLSALGWGALIFIITAAAESLYRQRYPDKLALSHILRWRGLRTKRAFRSLVLGLTLAPCFIAYQTLFYLLANKFGAWAPAEVPYDDLLNTRLPWAFVLLAGFLPAVSEEFFFRMFSIPFLEKLLKNGWLALGLAGFIWGFGHAGYPNQPFYIRGVEVGLAGILVGLVMVRLDILAVLIWHYTVDATYTALLMLRSHDTYIALSGALTAFIFLVPLIVAIWGYLRRGGFESDAGLTNQDEVLPPGEEPEMEEFEREWVMIDYLPLSTRRILIGGLAVGLLLSLYAVHVERFGDFVDFGITRIQAKQKADEFLVTEGVDVSSYDWVVYAHSRFHPLEGKYILEHADVGKANRFFGGEMKSVFWAVRYFKPLEKEEYRVYIDPREGSVYTFEHIVAEDAPGAEVSEERALALARDFLLSRGFDPQAFDLVESSTEKRPARRDYRFIWQAREGDPRNIGGARFRLGLEVVGDRVGRFWPFLKLPEDWVRARQKETAWTAMRFWGRILLIGALAFFGLAIFINAARHGLIRWRRTLGLAAGVAVLYGLDLLNKLPLFYRDYTTSLDPTIYVITQIAGDAMTMTIIFVLAVLAIGGGSVLYPEALQILERSYRRPRARDAIISSLLLTGTIMGLGQLRHWLMDHFPQRASVSGLSLPNDIDTVLPVASQLISAIFATLAVTVVLGVIAHLARRHLKGAGLKTLVIILILPFLVPDEARSRSEFLFGLAWLGITVGAALALLYGVFRDNVLAYLVGIFLTACVTNGIRLIQQSSLFLTVNGGLLLAIAGWIVVWLLSSGPLTSSRTTSRNRPLG